MAGRLACFPYLRTFRAFSFVDFASRRKAFFSSRLLLIGFASLLSSSSSGIVFFLFLAGRKILELLKSAGPQAKETYAGILSEKVRFHMSSLWRRCRRRHCYRCCRCWCFLFCLMVLSSLLLLLLL